MIWNLSKEKLKAYFGDDNPPDFNTHANYINFLSTISEGINLKFEQDFESCIKNPDRLLDKKVKLISFTLRSIEEESKIILENNDFAVVCCSWIPVKSYYVIFNSLLILKYLITCDKNSFSSAHYEINNDFKGYIEREEMKFNKDDFNKIYKGDEIEKIWSWKPSSGESLKKVSFNKEDRLKQIIKKIIDYKREEFKRNKDIKSLAGKFKTEFLNKTRINISDFFYCYRIKANYSGMEFLDNDISDYKFKNFYSDYYKFLTNYYECLKEAINRLALIRFKREIITR